MLDDLVKRYRINKSKLGRWIGKTYTTVNMWTDGEYFNEENQKLVLGALRKAVAEGVLRIPEELNDDYFTARAEKAREAHRKYRASVITIFEMETKVGRTVTAEEKKKLELLDPAIVLDVPLCEMLVLSMRGKLRGDPHEVAAKNRAVRSAARKTKGSK